MGFNEKVHAYIAAKYYQYLTQYFGDRGKQAFLHATQYYALQRGRRMAQRAIRDGRQLTQETYNYYGEWVNTDEIKKEGCANVIEPQADGSMKVTVCPWYNQFQEMGLYEAGEIYCSDLDRSISRGFNPFLKYEMVQTLHNADYCIQRIQTGNICAGAEKGKNPESLRSFEYHCAHMYWSYNEVAEAIFLTEGRKVSENVLADFVSDYGQEMADTLMKYRNTNFNVCD